MIDMQSTGAKTSCNKLIFLLTVDAVDDRSRGTPFLFAHLNGRPYGTGHKAQREDQQDGGPQEGRDSHLR